MKALIKVIGVIVFCLVMYAIPILIACSFCLNWDVLLRLLLVFVGVIEFAIFCAWVSMEVDR